MAVSMASDASPVTVSIFSLPTSTSLPEASGTQESPIWPWILAGVLGGCFLLVGLVLLVITIVVVGKRKRKMYVVSGQSVSKRNSSSVATNVSQMKSMKYHRGTSTDTSININSHVTVGRTESGQHTHMQVVNRGYLLASNEAHTNDRVATQRRPLMPRVVSTKPRAEDGEDYDSEYSKVATTTEIQEISIHENVAYDLDGNGAATINSALQTTVVGSQRKVGPATAQTKKTPPVVKAKPKRVTSSSSNFGTSVTDHIPDSINKPECLDVSTAIYDMVKTEYGAEPEATDVTDIPRRQFYEPQYSNTSSSYQGSVQDRQEPYYNHRELMQQAEVLYSNLNKEPDEVVYGNLKKGPGTSTDEVVYGNLNKNIDSEDEYYNQREIMMIK